MPTLELRRCISLTALMTLFLLFSLLLTENVLAATITAEPTQGPAGTQVTVHGSAWPPGTLIELSWNFPPFVTVATARTDGNGAFTARITVPPGAPVGPTYVDAIDESGLRTGQAPFTVTAGQGQLPPEIVHVETFREGVLVFFRVFFTDPNNDAIGFRFRWPYGVETHPFSEPSFGRVSPGRIEYPFNLGCGTGSEYATTVEVWIYDSAGLFSQAVTVHLACTVTPPGIFATPTSGYMGFGWTGDSGHRGIDIWTGRASVGCVCSEPSGCAAAPGNEVRAAYAGTVEAIYWGDHSGNWRLPNASNPNGYPLSVVVLKHTNVPGVSGDIYTTYQHLANNETNQSYVRGDLSIGDRVRKYEAIGWQGNWRYYPENALVTHLHFEVAFAVQNQPMPTRRTVDPMPYLGLTYASCSGNPVYP